MAFEIGEINLNGWFLSKPRDNDSEYTITISDTISAGQQKKYRASNLIIDNHHYIIPGIKRVEIFNDIFNNTGATLLLYPNRNAAEGDWYIQIGPGSYYVMDNEVYMFVILNCSGILGNSYNDATVRLVFHLRHAPIEWLTLA